MRLRIAFTLLVAGALPHAALFAQDAVDQFEIPSGVPVIPGPKEAEKPAWPPTLVNTGEPITLPFDCQDEALETFGMACTEDDPCPIYADLTDVHRAGDWILVTGNFHDGASTLFSLLLVSQDGGATWTEAFERIPSGALDRIQFVDDRTGWISGQILQSLPRDPFFLLTTDGGKNWRRRPVSYEPLIASIEEFRFEDQDRGALILSAGSQSQRWVTQTGGGGWMIREVTDRALSLPEPRMPAPAPRWRLRADAKLESYIVEQREGDGFRRLAAFRIEAARCAPAPDVR